MNYFLIFLSLFILRNIIEMVVSKKIVKQNRYRDINISNITLLVFVVAYFYANFIVIYRLSIETPNLYLFVIGIFFVVLSYIGRLYALYSMGEKSLSQNIDIPNDSQLVTTGAFKIVRNPLYLFYALEIFSLLWMIQDWTLLLLAVINLVNTFVRIPIEEKKLTDRFGQKYIEYKNSTKRLIPFVY